MKSLPDYNAAARQAWLNEIQGKSRQSDFEKSLVWRYTLIAAIVVIAINIPLSPSPTNPVHGSTHSTV